MKIVIFISILLAAILILFLLVYFRKPIRQIFKKLDEVGTATSKNIEEVSKEICEGIKEWANENTKECQERTLKSIKEFVAAQEGNIYYQERVLKLKEIIKTVETTGKWPVSITEIYYIMRGNLDKK